MEAKVLGYPDLRFLVIPHPFGGIAESLVRDLGKRISLRLEEEFGKSSARASGAAAESGYRRFLSFDVDSRDELSWALSREELTDGLPVIAPSPERVERMRKYWPGDSQAIFDSIPPMHSKITYESLAANAVMAGCLPRHFPVIVQAIKAMMDPAFNLYGVQATTHPVGPLVIVSGPLAKELGIQSGSGCLGPGFLANATIGRAVRLILLNGGGAWPGRYDKATLGQPGKFSFCFAENEEASPFAPFRTELGIDKEYTAVTVVAGEAPHNINDHGSKTADGILRTIAGTMATTGNNNKYWNGDTYVVLCPEHAGLLAQDGLTMADVKRELHRLARVSVSIMSPLEFADAKKMKESNSSLGDYVDAEGKVAVVPTPDYIKIVVAGGEGKQSMWIPTFGMSYSITHVITNAQGKPVRTLSDFLSNGVINHFI
jgi:hypothetical protein